MCRQRGSAACGIWIRLLAMGLVLGGGERVLLGVPANTKLDGYRGIWFSIGQDNPPWGPKYSGGLGTYTANHVPIAIYAPQVDRTFFVYGGLDEATGDLLIMASWYDHATCTVPRPTVVYHKVGINDPHDNSALLIDRDGYLWVFISGRGTARPGFIYKSAAPYSTDEFVHVVTDERTYPQPWYLDDGVHPPVFMHLFTKYTAGRELYWATSSDGVNWSPHQKMAGFGGHYQTSMERDGKIGTAFNYHPGGNVDKRTNLYYLQTLDAGQTWTTADGTPVSVPLNTVNNPALLVDYQAQGLLCYINDTNFDDQGNPYIVYITSKNYAAGPAGDPRAWHLARWNGQEWICSDITTSDHNYDVGNFYIEGPMLRLFGPTENGPQVYGTGGEVAMWLSHDLGATWAKVRDITSGSQYNHSYVRRPRHARDPFYAFWADGDAFRRSPSHLYFCDRGGTRVWRLPSRMTGDFARPERTDDFGGAERSPLWHARFEAAADAAVAHGQQADQIVNAVGGSGLAAGNSPLTYAAYGQAGIGSAPVPGAGQYALSFPDDRTLAIDTNLVSDADGLADAVTLEGFFRTPQTALVTSPSNVGRRLVTQKRSDSDGSSRLAVGLHAGTTASTPGLLDYDGFAYTGTVLGDQAGGTGWGGPWTNPVSFGSHLSNDEMSIITAAEPQPHFPFVGTGARVSGTGGHCSRPLSQPINLGTDGTFYLSALLRKTSIAATSGDNLEIGLATSATVPATSSTIRLGMSSPDKFFIVDSAAGAQRGEVVANVPYFIVVKIVTSASGPDRCYMNVYAPGDSVPAADPGNEPNEWLLANELTSSALLTHLKLTIGAGLNKGEIDEIRVGTSYQSVTDPHAPIATGGGAANVLAVYWRGADNTDHLELGTTAVQPNNWYHFAATYDGSTLRWYLDGALQGTVLNALLVAPGPYDVAIGNNRIGENDRGFWGLLDQIRISNQPLPPSEFLLNTGSCQTACDSGGGSTLWCSGFETLIGGSVAHGQAASHACGAIINEHGIGGTPTGIAALTYAAYGQPEAGAAPGAVAGAFALRFSGEPSLAIDTNLTGNTGALSSALTFEGFFKSLDAGPVTSPEALARRLVSQPGPDAGDTRLAIGLHGSGAGNVLSVLWRDGSGGSHLVPGITPVQPQQWHHFALVLDGTELSWYLDGILQGHVTDAHMDSVAAASVVVGNARADDEADNGFHGLIDELRIFDRALSPAEFIIAPEGGDDEPCHPGCGRLFGDVDGDADVDQADFGRFQECLTGSLVFVPETDPSCLCFDRDGSGSNDALDLDAFIRCFTGPGMVWSHAVAPDCMP